MNRGKLGHFKFINVEEIKQLDAKCLQKSHSKAFSNSNESEEQMFLQKEYNQYVWKQISNQMTDYFRTKISDTVIDLKQTLNISEHDLRQLVTNGYTHLKMLSQITNEETLNGCGIRDGAVQQQLLLTAQWLRQYYSDCDDKPLESQLFASTVSGKKQTNHLNSISVPNTPMIDSIDLPWHSTWNSSRQNRSELESKTKSVGIQSNDNFISISKINLKTKSSNFLFKKTEDQSDDQIPDQKIDSTLETQNDKSI